MAGLTDNSVMPANSSHYANTGLLHSLSGGRILLCPQMISILFYITTFFALPLAAVAFALIFIPDWIAHRRLHKLRAQYLSTFNTENIDILSNDEMKKFGAEDGLGVLNSDHVLPEVDRLLGGKSDLEYIFVEPAYFEPVGNGMNSLYIYF